MLVALWNVLLPAGSLRTPELSRRLHRFHSAWEETARRTDAPPDEKLGCAPTGWRRGRYIHSTCGGAGETSAPRLLPPAPPHAKIVLLWCAIPRASSLRDHVSTMGGNPSSQRDV